jgi:ATP-dependent DNA helicase RecG
LPVSGRKSKSCSAHLLGRDDVPRVIDLSVSPADRHDRPPLRGRNLRDVVPGSVATVEVTIDKHRPVAAQPSARALI